MSGPVFEWTEDAEAMRLHALEDPTAITFEITGRNGTTFRIGYKVPAGQRARIVSQLESHDHIPSNDPDASTRTDVPPEYLLMVYGIECVPEGEDFPDQPGEPDE